MHNLIEPVIIFCLILWVAASHVEMGEVKAQLVKCQVEQNQQTRILNQSLREFFDDENIKAIQVLAGINLYE